MTYEFREIRLVVIILSIVIWVLSQYIGHGVGMVSSVKNLGKSQQNTYLDRLEKAGGIALIGALLSFITQVIPITMVSMFGWFTIFISILSILAIVTGVLRFRLPDVEESEQ